MYLLNSLPLPKPMEHHALEKCMKKGALPFFAAKPPCLPLWGRWAAVRRLGEGCLPSHLSQPVGLPAQLRPKSRALPGWALHALAGAVPEGEPSGGILT